MVADKIFSIIMKKLKDYRTDPKKSPSQDKAKRENLMKLLHVYSSLRKKEKSKMKLNNQTKLIKDIPFNNTEILQGSSHSSNNSDNIENDENYFDKCDKLPSDEKFELILVDNLDTSMDVINDVHHENIFNSENIQSDKCTEILSMSKAETSNVSLVVKEETDIPNNECDVQYNNGTNILDGENEFKNQLEFHYEDIKFETFNTNIGEKNNENKTRKGTKSSNINNNQFATVNGFLVRLGEGLRRLPYKQRAKLEIEYLRRLYEIQDELGIFDN